MKKLIQKSLSKFGYSVHKISIKTHEELLMVDLCRRLNISHCIDIGANKGQFAKSIRQAGFKGHIHSFEPLTSAHYALSKSSQNDSKWHISPRVAIGKACEKLTINVSKNSVSSSLLKIEKRHVSGAPESDYITQEEVDVKPLDSYLGEALNEKPYYLKIDTQGYEKHVLEGAKNILERTLVVQMEANLTSLYEGDWLFTECNEYMVSLGFMVFSIFKGFSDPGTGQALQMEMIFVRSSHIDQLS